MPSVISNHSCRQTKAAESTTRFCGQSAGTLGRVRLSSCAMGIANPQNRSDAISDFQPFVSPDEGGGVYHAILRPISWHLGPRSAIFLRHGNRQSAKQI